MHVTPHNWLSRRLVAVLSTAAFVVGTAALSTTPAAADTAPPDPATTTTVSADVLPTVQVNGVVWAQLIVGNTVYATGEFTSARPAGAASGTSETPRSNIVAYDLTTGVMVPTFAPVLNAQGLALAASADGSTIYVGGDFTAIDGTPRYRLAALSATTGAVVPGFAPTVDARVRSVVVSDGIVYAGGIFTTASGQPRTRLAAFDATTGALSAWAPSADDEVLAMAAPAGAGKLVVGGRFTTLNGEANYGLGALSTATAATMPFPANAIVRNAGNNAAIYSLTADTTQIYGTGYTFGTGGNLENSFAADITTGNLNWVAGCRGDTYSGAPVGNLFYIVGHSHDCSAIGTFPQSNPWTYQRAQALSTTQGIGGKVNLNGSFAGRPAPDMLHWLPTLAVGSYTGQSQAAWSVAANSQYVVLAGEFPSINGVPQQGLARFAVKSIAPNVEGPQGYSTATPTLVGVGAGAVRASWTAAWDRDNTRLTYELLRGAQLSTASIVGITKLDNNWWTRSAMVMTDTTAPPGTSQSYRVRVTDPLGNTMISTTRTVSVPSGTPSPRYYRDAVTADGAGSDWRLGEYSGTTGYSSTDTNDLTLGGSPQRGTAGAIVNDSDTATTLSATATVPGSTTGPAVAGPQTFSVETWFKTTTTSGGKIVGFGNKSTAASTSADRHLYMTNAGKLVLGVYPGTIRTVTSPNSYNNGAWHYAVGTLGSGGLTLYVDGAQVATRTDTTSAQAFSGYWRVGGDAVSSGWPTRPSSSNFAGALDEVAVYPTALTTQAVASHWNLGRGIYPNQAPTAAFTVTPQYLTAAFDGSASTDSDGTVASYAWNFGDNTTGTGATTSHTYASPGTYTATLTVADNAGAINATTRQVIATPPNQAPTASFTGTVTNLGVALDGSTSTDTDGTVTSYAWNYGDNTTGTGATTSHPYAMAGTYTVTLTVTDNSGATGTTTNPITVTDPPAGTVLAADAFGRTVANGFGTADTGGAWTLAGSGTTGSVGSGTGVVTVGIGKTATLRLPGVLSRDNDVTHSVSLDQQPTGGGSYLSTTVRSTSTGDYRARVRVLATGEVQASVTKVVAGTETALTTSLTVPGLTYTPGMKLSVRAQAFGASPTTVQMKVWASGTVEPSAWQRTITDTTAGLEAPGAVGLVSYLSGSATAALNTRYDDLAVVKL